MNNNLSSNEQPHARLWVALGGASLIVMGVIFLLQNFTSLQFGNWWIIFLVIPLIGLWARAWVLYQNSSRRFTRPVANAVLMGLMLLVIVLIFLFNLDWGKIWPIFLIAAGVGSILANLSAREK